MFGVFSWVGSFRSRVDVVGPEHVKSEEMGRRMTEPLDSLIGGVLANQCGVWEGRNTVCALVFYAVRSVISCFHVLEYWH